ncbi:MAG: hypothetical protein Q8O15_00620 [Rectinemataceae bacterium]|nr:hypothetical protein [Rectinemataceae bacterium]
MAMKFHEKSGRPVPVLALAVIAAIAAMLASCTSVPTSVPEDFTAAEIIQKAQEASDQYNYKASRFYYSTTLTRFGSEPVIAATCMYELAFISYKQGKYNDARKGFNELLDLYAKPENASLPSTYRILAIKVLAKLPPEKTVKKPAK